MESGLRCICLKQLMCFSNFVTFCILSVLSAILVYPIVLVIFFPFLVYRQVVKFIVQISDPKCGVMLTGMDATLAAPDPYENVPMVLAPYFTFTSHMDRRHIVNVINEQIIQPNLFPELKQRIVRKYGYFFRYSVSDFNVEHHVKYLYPECPGTPVKRSEIRRLGVDLIAKPPFDSTRSPWELVLIPNFVDENNPSIKSCMFLRVNHCLQDGFSMISFTQKLAQNPWKIQVGQRSKPHKSGIREVLMPYLKMLELVIAGPYQLINMLRFANDKNEFLEKVLSSTAEGDTWCPREMASRTIDGDRLRKIKHVHNVSVSSILITMAVEAVVNYMRLQCNNGFSKMPKKINFQMTFPVPGHPNAMTNHWTVATIPITIREDSDPVKTLLSVHKEYENLKTSIVPIVTLIISKLIGLLPICMFPNVKNVSSKTALLLNMPGPPESVDMFGYPWEDFGFTASRSGKSAFVAVVQFMKGKFWIDMAGARPIVRTHDDLKLLEEYAHNVLSELEAVTTNMDGVNII